MEKNVGGYDRIARFVLMVPLFVIGALGVTRTAPLDSTAGVVVGIAALAGAANLLFNVVTQKCLTNRLLGINTCEIKNEG